MRLTGGQIIAGLSLLLSTLVAFLMTIATSNLPPWIQSHASLAWFLLFPSLLLLLITTIKGAAADTAISQIDSDMRNRFIQVVSEAEDKTRHDSGLENVTNGAGKLAEWKDVNRRLIRILGVDNKNVWQPKKSTEQLARLILRLTKAIIPAMSQRGQWNDLIELARPAYKDMLIKRITGIKSNSTWQQLPCGSYTKDALIRELLKLSCKNHHQMSSKHIYTQEKHSESNKRLQGLKSLNYSF